MRGDLAFAQREVARMLVRRGVEPVEAWVGVDFDGTLAEKPEKYRGPGWTGKPVAVMVDRVRGWLAEGRNVKVLTARVSSTNPPAEVAEARAAIEQWTEEQFGQRLDVVSEKDPGMVELWDDRAVRVIENTGQVVKAATPGTRHVRADGKTWVKQQDGTWKPEGQERGSSAGQATAKVSKIPPGKPSPDGVSAHWNPQEGGLLFHGTRIPDGEEYVNGDKDGAVYLTNDFREAAGYAQGIHLGGEGTGISKVLYLSVGPGEMADVSDAVDETIANGDDDFSGIFDRARQSGLKYVTFKHPSNVGSGDQTVVVALDPGDTLGPNRVGWNLKGNRRWRKYGQNAVGKESSPPGTVHEWSDGPHHKMQDGTWEKVPDTGEEFGDIEIPKAPGGKAPAPGGDQIPPAPKDPGQAAEYMKQHLGWEAAVHPSSAQAVPLLADLGRGYVQEFPFLKGFISAIGDTDLVTAKLGHPEGANSGTLAAVHYGPQFKGMGLSVNFKNHGADPKVWEKSLASGVATGFHPQGSGTLKATIDHEMGHVLTKALHTRDPVLKKLWQSVGGKEKGGASHSQCSAVLSGYAATNIGEFISEAWSEYRNNPNPRPMVKAVGDRYSSLLRRKHELIEKLGGDKRALWALSLEDVEARAKGGSA